MIDIFVNYRGSMYLTKELAKHFRSCRSPVPIWEYDKVKFREVMPLQLKNSVSGRSEKGPDISCLQEMAVMFACMKKNDFRDVKCSEEISTFNKCYTDHVAKKKAIKQREQAGVFVSGKNARNLTTKQLNQLLGKYPQFNKS